MDALLTILTFVALTARVPSWLAITAHFWLSLAMLSNVIRDFGRLVNA